MSIASEITRIQGNIADAYTAANAKGATMPATQNSDNLATTISSISGGGEADPYPLLSRVKDDSNNEIGTVCGYHTDANNVKYAVVCLDAQYRLASAKYMSVRISLIADLARLATEALWDNADTATSNCTKILEYADTQGYTSSAVSHCRSKSFVIEGTTYYGQLPTAVELVNVFMYRTLINTKDTSVSQYSSLQVPTSKDVWSSTQRTDRLGYIIYQTGEMTSNYKDADAMVIPILEIPMN